jgi:hypothetical protein
MTLDATTFGIMKYTIMTLGAMIFNIIAFNI